MNLSDMFLSEFNHECKTTRRFLERIPNDKLTWRPHEKSMTVGQLALHIAASQKGIMQMAMADTFEFPDMDKPQDQPTSVDQILAAHDESVKAVQNDLPTISNDRMMQTWQATKNGNVILEFPRMLVIRNILLNHIYHHRGQLGVYLRLLGAKVPTAYGPSGDENFDGTPRELAAV